MNFHSYCPYFLTVLVKYSLDLSPHSAIDFGFCKNAADWKPVLHVRAQMKFWLYFLNFWFKANRIQYWRCPKLTEWLWILRKLTQVVRGMNLYLCILCTFIVQFWVKFCTRDLQILLVSIYGFWKSHHRQGCTFLNYIYAYTMKPYDIYFLCLQKK